MSDEPQPVLTERQARILAEADGELSAIVHGRPPDLAECGRLSWEIRKMYQRVVHIDNFSLRTACDAIAKAEKQAASDHIA